MQIFCRTPSKINEVENPQLKIDRFYGIHRTHSNSVTVRSKKKSGHTTEGAISDWQPLNQVRAVTFSLLKRAI